MAYNSFYPQYFPQNYNTPQPQIQPQIQPQMQTSFVNVRSEAEARNYPVGYGNSITFKDETQPYVYTKTMGFSQLDRPVFERYRLVKEEAQESPQPVQGGERTAYASKADLEALRSDLEVLRKQVTTLRKELGDNDESKVNSDANAT